MSSKQNYSLSIPLNPELYRRQVNEIFYTTDRNTWGSEGRAAGPLLRIVDIGNDYVQQQDYADAATLYDIIARGILDNYDSFRWHPYEGDLDDVIEECVEGLGRCLRGEQGDAAVRKQIIQTLYDVYNFDSSLENDDPAMSSRVPSMLVRWTTLEERLLQAGRQTENPRIGPYGSDNFNVGIEVAKAAEESHPQESIEIYQAYVEMYIEWRGRENYQIACQYLTSIRRLYQKLGKSDTWTSYIADLRERNARLPALKDEMAKAKL